MTAKRAFKPNLAGLRFPAVREPAVAGEAISLKVGVLNLTGLAGTRSDCGLIEAAS